MDKNKKFFIIIILIIFSIFITFQVYNKKHIDKNLKPNTKNIEEVESKLHTSKKNITIYIYKKDKVETKTIELKNSNVINNSEMIFSVIAKEFNIENVIFEKSYIKNKTLFLNFNSKTKFKFSNVDTEEKFIKSVLHSILENNKDYFDDILFTKNNTKENYIFGNISTQNPLTKNSF